jgi:CRISPR-associated protein Csx17
MAERVYKVELAGCAPEPLMAYLKALGVLRLVAEQRDAEARGWWQGDIFLLQSVVDSDGLVRFFLEDYRPSPILSPWNGDGGFLSDAGTSVDTIEWFRRSSDSRLEGIRAAIKATDNVPLIKEFREKRDRAKELDKLKKAKERELKETASAAGRAERVHEDPDKTRNEIKELSARLKKIKQSVVSNIRNDFLENSLGWLDCCMTVGINGLSQSPLLGTGGVDGRLDFATNFLLNVQLIFCDLAASSEQLHNRTCASRSLAPYSGVTAYFS